MVGKNYDTSMTDSDGWMVMDGWTVTSHAAPRHRCITPKIVKP